MTLQLEYKCTEAERKEAQSLHLHGQFGGGPKWRSSILFYGFAAAMLTLLIFWLKRQTAGERWAFGILFVLVYGALLFFKRRERKKRADDQSIARVEISEQGILFDGGEKNRTAIPWSGFGKCLESPNVFTLVNRTNNILYILPKRVFSDDSSRDWFRSIATQPHSVVTGLDIAAPGRFAGKGIHVTVQLKYRDYVARIFTSWRTRGIAVAIFLFMFGIFIVQAIHPPPDAVVPAWKVFLIMIGMMIPMITGVLFFVSFYSWLTERKYLVKQHVALSNDGIEFASSDANGLMPWSTYQYYLENRWAFFIWRHQGSVWFMFPKRDFASPSDLEQCRELFQKNLEASRWFYF